MGMRALDSSEALRALRISSRADNLQREQEAPLGVMGSIWPPSQSSRESKALIPVQFS